MKNFLFLILFLTGNLFAYSQTIKGIVFNEETNEAIPFATIYFNGTFKGTIADENGKFELDNSNPTAMPLTISAIGFYSVSLANYSTGKYLKIALLPKVFELNEFEVRDKSLARKRRANLRIFKEEFLGITDNARKCEILNEQDIQFDYNSDYDTLIAYASKPILVLNKGLGYQVTYYLDKFEYYKQSMTVFFYGNILFTEDASLEGKGKELCERRRAETYRGSRMHFFRALWENKLKPNEFTIWSPSKEKIKYKKIVYQNIKEEKFLTKITNLKIDYFPDHSFVFFLKDTVYFDENGYFDPSGIKWEGEMANQRIADWLPYEYQPKPNKNNFQ